MKFPGFCGPTYQSRSIFADAQRCINLYPELIESGTGKSGAALYRTPGLEVFASSFGGVDDAVSGMIEINGRCFAMVGAMFCEIASDGSTSVGPLPVGGGSGDDVRMAASDTELVILYNGNIYSFDLATDNMTAVGSPSDNLTGLVWIDNYFVALKTDTQQIYISALNDGTSWDELDFASAEGRPDNLIDLAVINRELWLFGTRSIQPYYNTGDADFPFGPVPGTLLERGGIGKTVVGLDNTLFWCSAGERGAGMIWRAEGFRPVRISNHSVEYSLQAVDDLEDAVAWGYEDGGHTFYCIHTPNLDRTWCFDVATGLWHERAYWNAVSGQYERHRGNIHCYAFGKHLVADHTDSIVYEMSRDHYDDNGDSIRWARRMPYLSNEGKRIFHNSLELDMETAVGTALVTNPTVSLRWSNDHGSTWNTAITRPIGPYAAGASSQVRVRWNLLGSARDRVYEVYGTDAVNIALMEAYLDVTPGEH